MVFSARRAGIAGVLATLDPCARRRRKLMGHCLVPSASPEFHAKPTPTPVGFHPPTSRERLDVRMYVLRSALRASTKRPPARFIRGRRYPCTPRLRTFHTAQALAQASNPLPPPDSTPADRDGVNTTDREAKAAVDEPADAAVASEDPEVLAQKLQRSRESSRRYSAALRRQQRGKKAQGLPPVHIPDWFLRGRVIRLEDVPGGPQDVKPPTVLSVTVSQAESGERATCAIPVRGDSDTARILSRLVSGLWSRRLDDNERHKVEQYLEERIALVEKADTQESQSRNDAAVASTEAGRPSDVPIATITEDSAFTEAWTKLSKLHNDADMDPRTKIEAMRKQSAKLGMAAKKREIARTRQMGTSRRLSSLVVSEIRATIAASLSTLQPSAGDSFPSAKTNLILHSPTPEHEESIEECVVGTALEMGSDVICLTAQSVARIAGDYLGEGADPSPRSIRSLGYETYRLTAELGNAFGASDEVGEDESEWSQGSSLDHPDSSATRPRSVIIALSPALRAMTSNLKGMQFGSASQLEPNASTTNDDSGRSQSSSEVQLEDLKLSALLDALIDANDVKQSRGIVGNNMLGSRPSSQAQSLSKTPAFFDYSLSPESAKLELNSTLPAAARPDINMEVQVGSAPQALSVPSKSKIIYIKDFKELNATHYGGRIIQKLEELVRKRRTAGESIMIVGSTCSRELMPELSARYASIFVTT
jgi:hypothetical protein